MTATFGLTRLDLERLNNRRGEHRGSRRVLDDVNGDRRAERTITRGSDAAEALISEILRDRETLGECDCTECEAARGTTTEGM